MIVFKPEELLEISGGCQCGAVRYKAVVWLPSAHVCHCRMCQKAVGNLFESLVGSENTELEWTRGTPSVFQSSAQVERGFCSKCGTPLFYRDENASYTSLTIGSLDNPEMVKPVSQCGTEGRMSWFVELVTIQDEGATDSGNAEWVEGIRATNRQHPDHDTDQWPLTEKPK